jgi:hypothetical protein
MPECGLPGCQLRINLMSAVSEILVREYFELHGFLVRQQRKHIVRVVEDDEEIDFFVYNARWQEESGDFPFFLSSAELRRIERGIVGVKGWFSGTFSPALLTKEPAIARFAEPQFLKSAARFFGAGEPFTKILVLPSLPQSETLREQSIELLKGKGIDAVIPFRTILTDLIGAVEVNRNYHKSDLLQLIRILKNFDLFKESQLELFKPRRTRRG